MLPNNRRNERGNAFVFILIGIVLFAALAYTIARGFRSESTGKLTSQNINITVADLAATVQDMERGVDAMRSRSVSESDISFETTGISANGNCADESCKLFSTQGGRRTYKKLPSELTILGGADTRWQFSGTNELPGIGSDGGTIKNSDLVAIVEGLPIEICAKINAKLYGNSDIPVMSAIFDTSTGEPFAGTYGTNVVSTASGNIERKNSYCVKNGSGGLYLFYHVLLER